MFYNHKFSKKSFGMIEVIVVLGLFLLLIGTILQITVMSSKNLVINQERWQATLIGQNWLEEFRAIRDTNLIKGNLWDDWGTATSITNSERCFNKNMAKMVVPSGQCNINNLGQTYNSDILFFYAKLKYKHDYPSSTPTTSDIFTVDISWKNQGMVRTVSYSTFLKNLKVDQSITWPSPGGPSPSTGPTPWPHPLTVCLPDTSTPTAPGPGYIFSYGCTAPITNPTEYLQGGKFVFHPTSTGNVLATYTGPGLTGAYVDSQSGNFSGNYSLWVDNSATGGVPPAGATHAISGTVYGSVGIWTATPLSVDVTVDPATGAGTQYVHLMYAYTVTSVTGRVCGNDSLTGAPYCSAVQTFNPFSRVPSGINITVYYMSKLDLK